MFNTLFNDFDHCKTYATVENLEKAITKLGVSVQHAVLVKVPHGKNKDRFTAIFPWQGGANNHIVFLGFKVMG